MAHADFVLYIIKLVLGAISAFCAILLWSKTHDGAVMCLVAGVVILFAGVVYQMLLDMGFVPLIPHEFFGVPIVELMGLGNELVTLTQKERQLIESYRAASSETKEIINKILDIK